MNVIVQISGSLDDYLARWQLRLEKDNLLVETNSSTLYKVIRRDGSPALLKHLKEDERVDEAAGGALMKWYGPDCAAEIYKYDDGAQLMEYLDGPSLLDLYDVFGEDEVNDIIVGLLLRMHGKRDEPPPAGLEPLEHRFNALHNQATIDINGGLDSIFVRASTLTHHLLAAPTKPIPLHGDGHHGNILLHTSQHAWKVIDPKGLFGAPEYEIGNFYRNPLGRPDVTQSESRILTMTRRFSQATGYSEERMLQFGAVHAALSACWSLGDGKRAEAQESFAVAERIFALL